MMNHFIYLLRPVKADLMTTMTMDEERILGEHYAYLQGLLQAGQLLLAGPCTDAAFGIVVFTASDAAAAEELMVNDPAVRNGVMTGELHPFRISLLAK